VNVHPDNHLSLSSERRLEEFAAAIDRDADVPIGLQLGWALSARIHDGELQPGQRLPGLREMAQASGLNVNTVRAVYQRLEQRGLLESRQGSGTFVSATLRRPSAIGAIAADAAREAEAIGVDPREVAAALYVAMPQDSPGAAMAAGAEQNGVVSAAAGSDGEVKEETVVAAPARRRALRAQIATLERAIGEIEAEHPGVAPRPAATSAGSGPTLLSAQELEQVRSGLVRRLAQVQSAIDERAAGARVDGVRQEDRSPIPEDGEPASTAVPNSTTRPARTRTSPRPATAGI
jgi:GntR family transcriptional regulator